MNFEKLLPQVIKIIQKAGQALLETQPKVEKIEKKGKDFLTSADLKSDSLIFQELRALTPEIPIYSEENEEKVKKEIMWKEIMWIVDPLDGTINYFHQDNFWGVSIALVENQKTQLGVVYLPVLNQLVGVTREGKIIRKGNISSWGVRTDTRLSKGQIWTDWAKESIESTLSVFSKLAKSGLSPQIRLCCSASLLMVASGRISAYIHPQPGPEDIAAGCLIVERAGGYVTDLTGKAWTPFSTSILASNSLLHDQIFEVLFGKR